MPPLSPLLQKKPKKITKAKHNTHNNSMASINDYENLLSTSFSDANASFQSNSKSRWERKVRVKE